MITSLPGVSLVVHRHFITPHYIYLTVPKVACQSVAQIIGTQVTGETQVPDPNMWFRAKIPTIPRDKLLEHHESLPQFKFTFIRHPQERITSFWFGKQKFDARLSNTPKLAGCESLMDMLNRMMDEPDMLSVDMHLLPQTTILFDNSWMGTDQQTPVDYIGRLEQWNKSWDVIQQHTGITFDTSIKINDVPKRDLTAEEQRLINQVLDRHYTDDMNRFGYDKK